MASSVRVAFAQTAPAAQELRISGAVTTPLVLTVADLKGMPRKKLTVVNPHNKKTEVYEGVPLEDLLRKAGVTQGENLRGTAMASYVLAEAADGYRVLFSLAELDSGVLESEVLVADTMDGAALEPKRAVSGGCATREATRPLGQDAQVHHGRARGEPVVLEQS